MQPSGWPCCWGFWWRTASSAIGTSSICTKVDRRVSHSNEVLAGLEAVLSTLKDAETGERGYLITGNRDYLKPYLSAVRSVQDRVQRLRDLTADNPVQSRALPSSPRSRTKSWPSFAGRSMFETLWDSTPHAPW